MIILDLQKFSMNTKHHAVLLVSKQFNFYSFPNCELSNIAKKFCNIQISCETNEHVSQSNNFTNHPDVLIIDRNRTQLRLEDISQIREFCLFPPQFGSKRLIFIENCERMNLHCVNSLLKSIEEPAAHVFFLLTSAHRDALSATLLSRVQTHFINLKSLPKKNFIDEFDSEDKEFVEEIIFSANSNVFFGKQLTDEKKFSKTPGKLFKILTYCDKISKKYKDEELRNLILYYVSERLKKDNAFIVSARFIIAHMRSWKKAEQFRPSSQFWLLRIFLTIDSSGSHGHAAG